MKTNKLQNKIKQLSNKNINFDLKIISKLNVNIKNKF